MSYFNKPSPCVKLTRKTGFSGKSIEYILPLDSEVQFAASQILKKPVQTFFDDLKQFVTGSGGIIGAVAGFAFSLMDLFGVQLFSKYYYSQAWVGEEPTPFTLTFKFFRGMNGVWNAETEVRDPILDIVKQCVPWDSLASNEQGPILTAPIPNTFEAFSLFSVNIIETLANLAASTGTVSKSEVSAALSVVPSTSVSGFQSILSAAKKIASNKTWDVYFGWSNGDENSFKSYYHITTSIVESVSWNFSTAMEKNGDKINPIMGTLTLNFKTQAIITSSDFKRG
jgi:hypothetical protein